MGWHNPDWYYTAGSDDPEDEDEKIAAAEQAWEYEREQELIDADK